MLVLARPYHMDPGIGHEIEAEIQAYGYPISGSSTSRRSGPDGLALRADSEPATSRARSTSPTSGPSSYSSNTNEIMWGAKSAARMPVDRLRGAALQLRVRHGPADLHPVAEDRGSSGTLYFKFGDLDSTKPAGGIKIRVETISHYLDKYSPQIIRRKLSYLSSHCPLAELNSSRDNSKPELPESLWCKLRRIDFIVKKVFHTER